MAVLEVVLPTVVCCDMDLVVIPDPMMGEDGADEAGLCRCVRAAWALTPVVGEAVGVCGDVEVRCTSSAIVAVVDCVVLEEEELVERDLVCMV